jgi:hypothetical protein
MALALFVGRFEHRSGKQIRYGSRKALLVSPAFIAPPRDFGVACLALGRDLVSGQVDVLGTQLEEVVE